MATHNARQLGGSYKLHAVGQGFPSLCWMHLQENLPPLQFQRCMALISAQTRDVRSGRTPLPQQPGARILQNSLSRKAKRSTLRGCVGSMTRNTSCWTTATSSTLGMARILQLRPYACAAISSSWARTCMLSMTGWPTPLSASMPGVTAWGEPLRSMSSQSSTSELAKSSLKAYVIDKLLQRICSEMCRSRRPTLERHLTPAS